MAHGEAVEKETVGTNHRLRRDGYNFVTTDKRLVCGLANQVITGLTQVPRGGVCLANARLGIGGRALSTRVYLIHEQCGSLQCTRRERWC